MTFVLKCLRSTITGVEHNATTSTPPISRASTKSKTERKSLDGRGVPHYNTRIPKIEQICHIRTFAEINRESEVQGGRGMPCWTVHDCDPDLQRKVWRQNRTTGMESHCRSSYSASGHCNRGTCHWTCHIRVCRQDNRTEVSRDFLPRKRVEIRHFPSTCADAETSYL